MNSRRKFIKNCSAASLAFTLSPFTYIQDTIPQDYLLGKGNPNFIKKNGYTLLEQAAEAFEKMRKAAQKDGVPIQVVSSYRSYNHQKRIWSRKYDTYTQRGLSPTESIKKIIEYSTIPGTSRHHWGTDIDIIQSNTNVQGDVLVPNKFHGTGPFCKLKEWLDTHANSFDFYLVYTDAPDRKGFKYEPWHYSYAPLSKRYLDAYQKIDIKKVLLEDDLKGSEAFSQDFMQHYWDENIMDINPQLLS